MLARMRLRAVFSVAIALAACGDDGSSLPIDSAPIEDSHAGSDATEIDAASGTFTLTSTAYADGGVIPSAQACASKGGLNQSPPLAWTNAPAGTMSFAIVFTDRDNNNLIHSAIYDILGTSTSIPGNVDKVYAPTAVPGAHHVAAYNGTRGYEGPCPNAAHHYEHKIYALATATVPSSMMSTTRMQLVAELEAHNLGSATLTATFTPP
jgi:Raf kinase inhibitor-like YbhB/YbcL family protein